MNTFGIWQGNQVIEGVKDAAGLPGRRKGLFGKQAPPSFRQTPHFRRIARERGRFFSKTTKQNNRNGAQTEPE